MSRDFTCHDDVGLGVSGQMDDTGASSGTFSYRRIFPWLHLFRAFRIAVDPRKMLLAGLGLLCIAAGQWVLTQLPFSQGLSDVVVEPAWPWRQSPGFGNPLEVSQPFRSADADTRQASPAGPLLLLKPATDVVDTALMLIRVDLTWPMAAYAWTKLIWMLLVWALFGGAITRMAAVQFARDERIGMWAALKFSADKLLSYASAPLLAVGGIGFFWLVCLAGGFLIGRIPYVGAPIVGALWFIPLVLGVVMALILIGVSAGWPLMFATISTEGSDAFDGLSRSYSYVYDRPWHYLWFAAVALVYGTAVILFVTLLFSLVVYLAGWSVGSGMGMGEIGILYSAAPENLSGTGPFASPAEAESTSLGGRFTQFWLYAVAVLQSGFVYSYFWTATTIIYFLLRQSDDATDLDEIYLPQQPEEDELLPLVGVADSDQPVIERPATEVPPPLEEEGKEADDGNANNSSGEAAT